MNNVIAAVAGICSAGGLLIPGLYRDIAVYRTAWKANDAVTLLIIPALLLSYRSMRSGNLRSLVIWTGLLAYVFYNYAFYLFGARFNAFFPLYAALVTLSLYAIVLALFSARARIQETPEATGRRWLIAFLLLIAIPLAIVELGEYGKFLLRGEEPAFPTLILALDFSLVLPNTLVAVILLVKKNPWGYWLAGIMLVKSIGYGLVLSTGTVAIAARGLSPFDPLFPYYLFLVAGGVTFLFILLNARKKNMLV